MESTPRVHAESNRESTPRRYLCNAFMICMGIMVTVLVQFIMQACGVFEMKFTLLVSNETAFQLPVSDQQFPIANNGFRYDQYLGTRFCQGDGIPSRTRNRIYGGSPVDIEEVPWAVAVMFSNGNESTWRVVCGGTVISSKMILSAAHCFPPRINATMIKIAAGSTYIPSPKQFLGVKQIHNHESYDSRSMQYDLSVLELNEPLVYSEKILPACLPTQDKPLRILKECDVSGWGLTETGDTSQRVLHARINYLEDSKCESKFDDVDLDTMVCYDSDRGSDTCQGDSGASIICSTGTADITMGVSSYGNTCGQGGVYARITPENYDWIIAKLLEAQEH